MNRFTVNENSVQNFASYLHEHERSGATVEKYLRDMRAFCAFVQGRDIDKQTIMEYKAHLGAHYAVASANSMLAQPTNLIMITDSNRTPTVAVCFLLCR
jgi:site-specific recombinase XerD